MAAIRRTRLKIFIDCQYKIIVSFDGKDNHMRSVFFCFFILMFLSCSQSKEEKGRVLYTTHCASCHIAPDIQSLPRNLWIEKVLPEMAARMGIKEGTFNPLGKLPFAEQEAILKTGVYPYAPIIAKEDWNLLKQYILDLAPDSLNRIERTKKAQELNQFDAKAISLDSVTGSRVTYLKFDESSDQLIIGDMAGRLLNYDFEKDTVVRKGNFGSALVDYANVNGTQFVTTMGLVDPSAIPRGRIIMVQDQKGSAIRMPFHRPVHTLVHDLNKDGTDELIVSEFGDLAGSLSLLTKQPQGYDKKVLLNQPGTIRVVVEDMNGDGKEDLVVLTSQGDEGITILYQKEDLTFAAEQVLRFPPIYGTSWFELVDYDGDGDKDLITVHGDNADETYVQKPYHGLRIHLNNGDNEFEEAYFYPLNGATRVIAKDFDADGDFDLAVLSTFPDYANYPEYSFVYLQNENTENFDFTPHTFKDSGLGKWFIMDSADVDGDGDEDIILGAFTKVFAPTPENLVELWRENNQDLLLLRNNLIQKP